LAGRATLSDWKRLMSTWVSPVGIASYRMGHAGFASSLQASPNDRPQLGLLEKSSRMAGRLG
jgi:hypothetical protein